MVCPLGLADRLSAGVARGRELEACRRGQRGCALVSGDGAAEHVGDVSVGRHVEAVLLADYTQRADQLTLWREQRAGDGVDAAQYLAVGHRNSHAANI
jgi:hypothetical protein